MLRFKFRRRKRDGPVGNIVFFSVFAGFSIFWVIAFYRQETRRDGQQEWPIVTATIQRTEILRSGEKLYLCRHINFDWQGQPINTRTRPFEDDANAPTGNYAVLARRRDRTLPGEQITVHVDPTDATVVTLPGSNRAKWIGLAGGLLFVVAGLWGLRASLRWKRTGSRQHLELGEGTKLLIVTLFFAGAATFGILSLLMMSMPTLLDWQSAKSWPVVPCTVVDQWIESDRETSKVRVLYEYTWNRDIYRSDRRKWIEPQDNVTDKRAQQQIYAVGSHHTCYVDPSDPYTALLDRDLGWSGLFVLFPIPFLLMGGGGVIMLARRWASGRSLLNG
jgi:hypothetical protein